MGRIERVQHVPTCFQPPLLAEIEAAVKAEVELSQGRAEERVATAGADPYGTL